MVFIPVTGDEAGAVRAGEPLGRGPAYASTQALRATFEFAPEATEEADFAAQVFAALRCLAIGIDRCVLAVEVAALPAETGERDFGEVERPGVRWRDVRAVFAGEITSGSGEYASAARGRTLPDLWDDDATHDFLANHDLLWFDPTELDQALTRLGDSPTTGD